MYSEVWDSVPPTALRLEDAFVVFDLDGTLADIRHRLRYIKNDPVDWEGFFRACVDDTVIEPNLKVLKNLIRGNAGFLIVILSGRNDMVQDETVMWLNHNRIPFDFLLMRPDGDRRPDEVLKKEMAENFGLNPFNTLGIFDDRKRVVDMWRREGFHVWHVADGNF